MELSQEELERMVKGTPEKPYVTFYDHAVLNRDRSKAAGRRVYDTVLYVKKKFPGVNDYQPRRASKSDIEKYPAEYDLYRRSKTDASMPSIDLIPGLEIAYRQELRDMGIANIGQLVEAKTLPPHLEPAQRIAAALISAMEQHNGESEEGTASDRRIDGDHVGQQGFAGNGRLQHGGPERVHADRRLNGHQGQEGREEKSREEKSLQEEGLSLERSQGLNADFSLEWAYR